MSKIDLNECDKACFSCIRSYKNKHQLLKGQEFEISCGGIPKSYISSPMLSILPPEEQASANTMLDPVAWAGATLDWHCLDPTGEIWKRKNPEEYYRWIEKNPNKPILGHSRYHRPYQADILRCTSKNKVFRMGRQLGKTEGIVINILFHMFTKPGVSQDEGFNVIVITPYQAQIELIFDRIIQLIHSSPLTQNSLKRDVKAPIYTIELHNDSKVRGFSCIAGTMIVTKRGLIAIEKLIESDTVLSLNTVSQLLEYLPISEIHLPNFKQVYKVTLNDGHEVTVSDDHPFWTQIGWQKLKDLYVGDKVATATTYKFDNSDQTIDDLAYIIGLLLGDGTITEKTFQDGGARFISGNPLIQQAFETSLSRLKIPWRVHVDKRTGSLGYTIYKRVQIPNMRAQDRPLNELTSALHSLDLIGKTSIDKFIPLKMLNGSASVRRGLLKGLLETDGYVQADGNAGFCSISKDLAYGVRDLLNSFGIKSSVRVKKQKGKLAPVKTEQRFIESKSDLYVVTVASKSHAKRLTKVINLANKGPIYSRFLANLEDVINQSDDIFFSKIKAIEPCGMATTYDISVGDGSNNFIANGIVLHNTAGTKSGSNAGSVRGQHGQMLVFDEADYLAPADMEAALSVTTNYPDATVWMSSTPSGKREKFYQLCMSKGWKEYYLPSTANPMYDEHQDRKFRETLSSISYKHEVLAEFGEQEEGVFQNVLVQAAKRDYKYGSLPYQNTWRYTVGVDWNDTKNGTTIAVLGFNPSRNRFVLVDRYIVSKEGWTQLSACQKIAEVNRLWNPMSIYIDAGYGGTQWEILRKFGYDALRDPTKGAAHPDAKIPHILKQYDFGSRIDTRDIFTGMPLKKDAKPFLVETTVRRFEAQDFEFPSSDNNLEAQLLGYIIDRITPTGRPVYRASDEVAGDHLLDAVMLSIVAFVLEATPIGRPIIERDLVFSGFFGEKREAEIHPGDTVVYPDTKYKNEQERDRHRPSTDRTEQFNQQMSLFKKHELPGAHIKTESHVGVWDWPGFNRDQPKPKVRTWTEAEASARKRQGLLPIRTSKPRRKNI